MKLNEISAKYAQPQDLTNLRKKSRIRGKNRKLTQEHVLGKLQIWAKFVRDLRGDYTKIAHKDPSNKIPQQIHEI